MNKVLQATLAFWVIKIAATTLAETGGDAVSMTLDVGYAISTLILFGFFAVSASAQTRRENFTLSSTGRSSWPPPRSAPRWPTSPIARSDMSEDR